MEEITSQGKEVGSDVKVKDDMGNLKDKDNNDRGNNDGKLPLLPLYVTPGLSSQKQLAVLKKV